MKYEEEFEYLKTTFPDSIVEVIESNVNNLVTIRFGHLKRVTEFLMDCGINFCHYNGTIKFQEDELRMID